ncbi:MAG: GP88 family protein, partial [Gemmataceae bacterium]
MAKVRFLLGIDNQKLGSGGIGHFDLPAVTTCPGRTPDVCVRRCYARAGRFRMPIVADRLAWCFEQSQRSNFVARMVREVRVRGLRLVRWHVSGDVYDVPYAGRMLAVMRRLPRVRWWLYTRSWRVPAIEGVLRRMALLPNCKVWYSLDRATGVPAEKPPDVRYAFLQDDDTPAGDADLVFRTRGMLHAPRVGLPLVCPTDTPAGRRTGANCGSCGHC